ncbi:hypothetical protein FGO68_gene12998 [Halteria grandinella]|uniref:Uncharacterized protein n=1 Tax=Halteria grandinella TaxID=5974 RepID=A0A8J8NGK0_HALGN|nr:hypothetical protein FGO68_gene12998 [Halteria grandinella]
MPIFAAVFFHWYFGRFEEEEFVQRFGSLYLNLKPDKKSALHHTVLYFVRRLLFALSIVLLDTAPYLQFVLFTLSSLCLLCFQLSVKPMDDGISQALEIFNEFTILSVGVFTFPYSCDYFDESSSEGNQVAGWVLSGLVLLNVAVNQIAMVATVVWKLIQFVRRKLCRGQVQKGVDTDIVTQDDNKFMKTGLIGVIQHEIPSRALPLDISEKQVKKQLRDVDFDNALMRRPDLAPQRKIYGVKQRLGVIPQQLLLKVQRLESMRKFQVEEIEEQVYSYGQEESSQKQQSEEINESSREREELGMYEGDPITRGGQSPPPRQNIWA